MTANVCGSIRIGEVNGVGPGSAWLLGCRAAVCNRAVTSMPPLPASLQAQHFRRPLTGSVRGAQPHSRITRQHARISPGIEAASHSWLRWVFASQNSGQILGVRRKAEAYEQALAIDGPCHSDHYSKLRRATIDCPSAVSKVSQNCPSPPLGLKICHMAIGQPGLKEVQKKEQQRQAAGLSIVAGSRFQPL